jgi:Cu(I)/Ag(I) efflux system membrane fusion protein
MHADVSAIGQVAYDETGLTDVTLKTRGWITSLRVDKTGQRVARGQPLFSFYSPELLNAEQDFLLAQHGAMADAGTNGSFAAAARARLRLLDVSDAQIDAIAKSGTPSQSVTYFSPASGYVIEKNVVEGASVEPGMRLFRIAALDRVWIDVDLYEADLGRVRVGQRADVTLDYTPGRFEAKVAWVYPFVDPKSRTGRVRVELKNDALELKPGMFAHVALETDLGDRIQIPTSAIVYTGPRRLVFVDLGQGRLEPREIEIGAQSGERTEVHGGIKAGEVVVSSGVFLVAAEARIRTAAKYWDAALDAGAEGSP